MTWSTHGLSTTAWSSSAWADGGIDLQTPPAYHVGILAAISVIGELAQISGSEGTATCRVIVSQPDADDLLMGMQRTNFQRNTLIVKRSQYPGTPKLGDTVTVHFRHGGIKTFTIAASEDGSRVYRHVDPQGQYLRLYVVMASSVGVEA